MRGAALATLCCDLGWPKSIEQVDRAGIAVDAEPLAAANPASDLVDAHDGRQTEFPGDDRSVRKNAAGLHHQTPRRKNSGTQAGSVDGQTRMKPSPAGAPSRRFQDQGLAFGHAR